MITGTKYVASDKEILTIGAGVAGAWESPHGKYVIGVKLIKERRYR